MLNILPAPAAQLKPNCPSATQMAGSKYACSFGDFRSWTRQGSTSDRDLEFMYVCLTRQGVLHCIYSGLSHNCSGNLCRHLQTLADVSFKKHLPVELKVKGEDLVNLPLWLFFRLPMARCTTLDAWLSKIPPGRLKPRLWVAMCPSGRDAWNPLGKLGFGWVA